MHPAIIPAVAAGGIAAIALRLRAMKKGSATAQIAAPAKPGATAPAVAPKPPPPPAAIPPVIKPTVPVATGPKAVVTTNDPPPSGDLIVRSGPSLASPQIGGAEKNGIVTVLDDSDDTFAKIQWSGGIRWPAVTGFARKQFLRPLDASGAATVIQQAASTLSSGDGIAADGQKAIVTTNDPAPAGDLIVRSSPSATAPQIGGAEKNGTVTILDSSDPTFAKIRWNGGSRWPAVTGFARKAFLKLV